MLGKALAGTKFAAVRCSPLLRAKETCEIAGFGSVAEVDEGLREWDYGVYEGRTSQDIQAEIPGWSVWKDAIVGGETVEQVGARADGVIARALSAGGGPRFKIENWGTRRRRRMWCASRCLPMRTFCAFWRRAGLGSGRAAAASSRWERGASAFWGGRRRRA